MSRRYAVVRIVLGLLLLTAAGLKLYGLGVSAVPRVGWFAQPWVQLAVAEWELVLGLWLLSGVYPIGSWVAAVGTFLAFAGVSAYLGWSGVASCGCFGTIHASPWYAFGVDVAALSLPAIGRSRVTTSSWEEWRRSVVGGLKWVGWAGAMLVGLTAAGVWYAGSPEAALARLRGESLSVAEPYLDFGSAHPGDDLRATITVRNWTDRPVRLVGGTSDCSCTTLGDLPVTIEPGGHANLGIGFHVPATSGRLTRTVFLRTDCLEQPVVRFHIGCRVE